MVLRLKTRESRSLPGLPRAVRVSSCRPASLHKRFGVHPDGGHTVPSSTDDERVRKGGALAGADPQGSSGRKVGRVEGPLGVERPPGAGWSSPVARQAHNLKVAGSNPAPATNPSKPSQTTFQPALHMPARRSIDPVGLSALARPPGARRSRGSRLFLKLPVGPRQPAGRSLPFLLPFLLALLLPFLLPFPDRLRGRDAVPACLPRLWWPWAGGRRRGHGRGHGRGRRRQRGRERPLEGDRPASPSLPPTDHPVAPSGARGPHERSKRHVPLMSPSPARPTRARPVPRPARACP